MLAGLQTLVIIKKAQVTNLRQLRVGSIWDLAKDGGFCYLVAGLEILVIIKKAQCANLRKCKIMWIGASSFGCFRLCNGSNCMLLTRLVLGHTQIALFVLNLFRYSTGVSPVIFLNTLRKAFVSEYPTSYITSLTVLPFVSNPFLAASIFTRWMYSAAVLCVAFLNLLSKLLLAMANRSQMPSTVNFCW